MAMLVSSKAPLTVRPAHPRSLCSSNAAAAAVAMAVHRRYPPCRSLVAAAAASREALPPRPGAAAVRGRKGNAGADFADELRKAAMRLHTRDQSIEGERDPDGPPISMWETTIDSYLRFLVDNKLVYDTLESFLLQSTNPIYDAFRNTGLERSERLAMDLSWFKEQGHVIPQPSSPGTTYACYLKDLSPKDHQAFICHFYFTYFGHSAGGRMIGKRVSEKLLNKKELEFYKWDGDIVQILHSVKEKINQVASNWTREEKDHCLEEGNNAFEYSDKLLKMIVA